MFTALSACVLPIGPEFEDPPAVANFQPFVVSVDPDAETTQQILAKPPKFKIQVSDPNPGDKLTVRWVANYPLYVQNATYLVGDSQEMALPPEPEGRVTFESPELSCDKFPLSTEKTLVAIVSDDGFLPPDSPLITDKSHRYNYTKAIDPKTKLPIQSLVMVGWRITGCQ